MSSDIIVNNQVVNMKCSVRFLKIRFEGGMSHNFDFKMQIPAFHKMETRPTIPPSGSCEYILKIGKVFNRKGQL